MGQIGIALRSARTRRGLTLEQAAQDTRISLRFLEALEAEQFAALPAPVYVRGFLRSYSNYLHIDPQPLLDELPANTQPRTRQEPHAVVAPVPSRPPARAAPPSPPRPAEAWEPPRAEPPYDEDDRLYVPPPRPAAASDGDPVARAAAAGILVERPGREAEGSGARVLAIAGAVLIGLVALALVGLLFGGDGDDGQQAGAPLGPTSERTVGTVIPVGSATPRTTTPGATSITTATTGGTPGQTPTTVAGVTTVPGSTATATAGAPTATPGPTEVPTATPVPPTPTAIPPTPTPTPPPPPHEVGFGECSGPSQSPDCGEKPWLVVCPPDGRWFVDVGRDYPNPGWPTNQANNYGEAITAGMNRCP